MNESTVYQYLRNGLSGKVLLTRIESSAGNGVPDLIIHTKGKHIFVEIKYIPSWPKREDTLIKMPLRAEQKVWLKTRGELSGDCWVFARVGDDFFMVPWFVGLRLCDGWPKVQWLRLPHWHKRIDFIELGEILNGTQINDGES